VPKLNYGTSVAEPAVPIAGAYLSMLDHKSGGADAKFGAHGQYSDWSDDPNGHSSRQQIAEIVAKRS
jgi:hypothetical protein